MTPFLCVQSVITALYPNRSVTTALRPCVLTVIAPPVRDTTTAKGRLQHDRRAERRRTKKSVKNLDDLKTYYEAQRAKKEAKATRPFFWRFVAVAFGVGLSIFFSVGLAVFSGFRDEFRDNRRDFLIASRILDEKKEDLKKINDEYSKSSKKLSVVSRDLKHTKETLEAKNKDLLETREKLLKLTSSLDGRRISGYHFTLSNPEPHVTYGQFIGPILDKTRASDYLPPELPTMRIFILRNGRIAYRVRTTKEDGKYIGRRTTFEEGKWSFDGDIYTITLLIDDEPIIELRLNKKQLHEFEEKQRDNLCFSAKILSKLAANFPDEKAVCTDPIIR
ncbi:MAG: hypothetical protein MRY74_07520 [Neomegalonema sp.]|nr:hypothetical protein [Neomegalonema sp.]